MSYDLVEQFLEFRRANHSNPQGDLAVGAPAGKSLLIREVTLPGIGTVATLVDVSRQTAAGRAAEARALELQRLARTGSLTNLANRRYFFEVAEEECEHADRYARTLSLVLVDVDHFKQVNERFGHDTGDAGLQYIAEVIKSVARTQDLVARLGGEQFAVLLPETSNLDAARFAERMRSAVELASTQARPGTVQVTASCGVAQRELGETGIADALSRADAFLYEAKRQGRNRVSSGWTPVALQRPA